MTQIKIKTPPSSHILQLATFLSRRQRKPAWCRMLEFPQCQGRFKRIVQTTTARLNYDLVPV
jgi:hypothetical protein